MYRFGSILVICLLSLSSTFAQVGTNPKLDEHRKFKDINLGDSYSKWSSHLAYKDSTAGRVVYTLDMAKCCQTLFNFEVDNIDLIFTTGKVVSIEISLKKFQEARTSVDRGLELYNTIEGQFNTLFGAYYGKSSSKTNPIVMTQWLGKSTVLEIRYNYFGVNKGDRVTVRVADLDYLLANLKGGF